MSTAQLARLRALTAHVRDAIARARAMANEAARTRLAAWKMQDQAAAVRRRCAAASNGGSAFVLDTHTNGTSLRMYG
jgi:hypothetical protein